jgi:hypothetical protein
VNITPALPNPHQPPVARDKTAVSAVRAPNRARDSVDEPERQTKPLQRIEQPERERLASRMENRLEKHLGSSARTSRALASYAEVADSGERSGLHDLLGFDAYA